MCLLEDSCSRDIRYGDPVHVWETVSRCGTLKNEPSLPKGPLAPSINLEAEISMARIQVKGGGFKPTKEILLPFWMPMLCLYL